MNAESGDLFPSPKAPTGPLADRMRPRSLNEVVGQEHLVGEGRILPRLLEAPRLPSLILWGPPGSGKTTLARLLAAARGAHYVGLSAVSAGVREVRQVVAEARRLQRSSRHTVLFLDEIHRFNKSQQDALLPHVETGLLTLLGATTDPPSFEVNAALLSRCRVLVLHPLTADDLRRVVRRALTDVTRGLGRVPVKLEPPAEDLLVTSADGDARRVLETLEIAVELARRQGGDGPCRVTEAEVREAVQRPLPRYDKQAEEHFNLISALHKSVRASDPQGAVYWTQRMLASGEDPLYVARRLVRMAVEDVGLADPQALPLAVAARDAVHFLGLPEGGTALVEVAVYLALAPKSNRVYLAEKEAQEAIGRTGSLAVPLAFRNAPTRLLRSLGYGRGYRYDHDEPEGVSGQDGLPEPLRGTRFYRPTSRGFEAELGERLRRVERKRGPADPESEPVSPETGGGAGGED